MLKRNPTSPSQAVPHRDWTQGNLLNNLLSLATPVIINQSLQLLGPLVDLIWIGRLGSLAVAGVGLAGFLVILVTAARMGFAVGVRAMIARSVGAKDYVGANHAAQQAFVISGGYFIIIALIGIFFSESIMSLMGVEANVVTIGASYMRIMFVGSVAMSFRFLTDSIMQASGDTITPMRITILFRIIHLVICPLLIFGWWVFPNLGTNGAAFSSIISESIGLSIGLWFLFSGRTRLLLTLKNFRLDGSMIWRIIRIGIPATITQIERHVANIVLILFITPFGTVALAAHSICHRIDVFQIMPAMGLGVGSGILAGQYLGANQPERAEKNGWLAVSLGTGFGVICALCVFFWAEAIAGLFNKEPDTLTMAAGFLRIAAISFMVVGFTAVLSQCISGTGDTVPTMLITILNLWIIQIPLAYLLSRYTGLGVYGVRWGMVLGVIAASTTYVIYFKAGRWKRKRV